MCFVSGISGDFLTPDAQGVRNMAISLVTPRGHALQLDNVHVGTRLQTLCERVCEHENVPAANGVPLVELRHADRVLKSGHTVDGTEQPLGAVGVNDGSVVVSVEFFAVSQLLSRSFSRVAHMLCARSVLVSHQVDCQDLGWQDRRSTCDR